MDNHVKKEHLPCDNEEVIFYCKKCNHDFKVVDDFNSHMKNHEMVDDDGAFKSVVATKEDLELMNLVYCYILESWAENEVDQPKVKQPLAHCKKSKCDSCNIEFLNSVDLDKLMKDNHGRNSEITEAMKQVDDMMVELTCRSCAYEGQTSDDMRKHKRKHCDFKCLKCDYVATCADKLKQHNQSNHLTVRVDIHCNTIEAERAPSVSCSQCDYKCKLNIQLRNHIKTKHQIIEDKKYKCNFCTFQSEFLVNIYEHKLAIHPEIPIEFNPKTISVKDMVLNLIAEQNIEIMEELQVLKKDLRGAFEQLSEEIRSNLEDTTKTAVLKISDKIVNLEKSKASVPNEKLRNEQNVSPPKTPPPPPPPSSRAALGAPVRPAYLKVKKSAYLQKPKILYLGDSVAHNADFSYLERQSGARIKTSKAYSSIKDSQARWPHKNFTDVTAAALVNTHEEDEFTHLVLAAPSVDISNMNTTQLKLNDNIEVYKQKIFISCQNIFTVAENAIRRHPQLKKVVIMEHAPRYDVSDVDPTGLKPKLAKYANSALAELLQSCAVKDRIVVGKHRLDCAGDQIAARYRDDWSSRYDGVHMYGRQGYRAYTSSVLEIIKSVLPTSPSRTVSPPSSHTTCPQALYQNRQKTSGHRYTVPVSNQFDVLGN